MSPAESIDAMKAVADVAEPAGRPLFERTRDMAVATARLVDADEGEDEGDPGRGGDGESPERDRPRQAEREERERRGEDDQASAVRAGSAPPDRHEPERGDGHNAREPELGSREERDR